MNMRKAMQSKIHLFGALLILLAGLSGCGPDKQDKFQAQVIDGDSSRGKRALYSHGCGSCHTIPGVSGANGQVGPSLAGVGQRMYLAGSVPHTPDNLVLWIMNPQQFNPQTLMPDLSITEEIARDMAAYLYTSTK
jgi:cytochrome c